MSKLNIWFDHDYLKFQTAKCKYADTVERTKGEVIGTDFRLYDCTSGDRCTCN